MLPLHLLRHFHAVVSEGGFSRAAEAMHVSQPAISRAVRELEGHAGAALLDRAGGPVRLTEAGRALFARVREVLAAERAAEEDLAALRGLTAGELCLGASTTIADYHLPPLVARFHAAHPGVTLRLVSANTHDVAESLAALALDVALVEGPVEAARIESVAWREEAMRIVAAPSHPLAGLAGVTPEALAGEVFLMREPGSGTRDAAEAALRHLGVSRYRVLEVGSTTAAKQVAAAGLGLAIVPLLAAQDQLALGTLVALRLALPPRILWRLSLSGRRPAPAAAAFITLLDEAAREQSQNA